jgi:hypothetical protein
MSSLLTITEVARQTGLTVQTVRRRADTVWSSFVTRVDGNRRFLRMPTVAAKPRAAPRKASPQEEPATIDLKNDRPVNQMAWALQWGERGLVVFPATRFLGDPLLPNWYQAANKFGTGGACKGQASIISWWAQWPDADIAAVPWRSGHFVVVAVKKEGGYESLKKLRRDLPKLDFEHWAPWGEHHLWFKTNSLVQSSSHRLGPGIHVVGPGRYVFLPNSRAPFIAQ